MEYSQNVQVVGYHDLAARPAFKMALQAVDDRWYLYLAHFWQPGWSILDVTDPARPELVRFIPGPENTWTLQIQVADGKMLTSLERIEAGWGGDPAKPFDEGVLIWDVRNPTDPKLLGQWRTGGLGTHRNYYDGGRYAHLAAAMPGYAGKIYVILDLADPRAPKEAGRWWWPGQHTAGGETLTEERVYLHGGAYVEGDRAYLPYSRAGFMIIDIADVSRPRLVGRLGVYPPFAGNLPGHTIVPLPSRRLAVVNSEAIRERCDEPVGFCGVVDIQNETEPRLMSLFPVPEPPPGAPYADFCGKGGRFGPHNQHQPQHNPWLEQRDDLIYLTYFNAGLQIYDVRNPRLPRIVGCYVPPDPEERRGLLPSELVVQSEDVLVDRRGNIYVTDKNLRVYILRYTG